MRFVRMHWLTLALVLGYLYFAYTQDYYPFATGSFSLTSL